MKWDADTLWKCYRDSKQFRDKAIDGLDDQLKRITGPYYLGEENNSSVSMSTQDFQYLSLVAPQLCYDNPRVRVTTNMPASMGEMAQGIEESMNKWAVDTDVQEPLTLAAFDALTRHANLYVDFGPWPGMHAEVLHAGGEVNKKGRPYLPRLMHKSMRAVGWDPLATKREDIRYHWHVFTAPKDSLLKEADEHPELGWNKDAINKAIGTDKLEDAGVKVDTRDTSNYDDMVVAVKFWVPELELPKSRGSKAGYNGTEMVMSLSPDSVGKLRPRMLAKPRPWFGPPTGPYDICGIYPVPDETMPLSPTVATTVQSLDLGDHLQAASVSAAAYKRLVFVDARDEQLVEKIRSAPDMFVIPINGLEKGSVVQIELGGVTDQQLAYIQMASAQVKEATGMFDAQRGNVTGIGTARENMIADSASSARLGFIKKQFVKGVQRSLRKVAWFMYHSKQVAIPLGLDAAKRMGMQSQIVMTPWGPKEIPPEPMFHGGYFWETTGMPFEFLNLRIELESMERTSEALQHARMEQVVQFVTVVAPLIPMNPHIEWDHVMRILADTTNMPDLAGIVDLDKAGQMGALMQQQQAAANAPDQPDAADSTPSIPTLGALPPITHTAANGGGKAPMEPGGGNKTAKPASSPKSPKPGKAGPKR